MRVRAPGRVNLIGEHTDYSGGLVLPAALEQGIQLTVSAAGGNRIHLRSDRFPDAVDVPADGSETPGQGWGRYVAAVAGELALLGRAPVGLSGELGSDLPAGAGLSSSAALEVALALALVEVAAMELTPLEVAAVAQRAELRAVGVPCGIMDQAASLLGRAGHALLLDCHTLGHRAVPVPEDFALLVIDSGVARQLEHSGYAARRRELEAGLAVLGGRRPADVDTAELEMLTRQLDDVPARRLRHVVTENARVRQAEQALRDGDRAALGRLFAESHRSLRHDFEVTVPELDQLVELAGEAGAVAARMTGGGFGGAIVVLAERVDAEHVARSVLDGYARTGGSAAVIVGRPGEGASIR